MEDPPPYSQSATSAVNTQPGGQYPATSENPPVVQYPSALPPDTKGYLPTNPSPAGYQGPPPAGYQGQPPAGYYGPPHGQTSVSPNTNVIYVVPPRPGVFGRILSPYPTLVFCNTCNMPVMTNIEYQVGLFCWMLIGVLLIFGCWLGCCLIPLCIKDCKDSVHHCPNCDSVLGVYRRF